MVTGPYTCLSRQLLPPARVKGVVAGVPSVALLWSLTTSASEVKLELHQPNNLEKLTPKLQLHMHTNL